MTEGLANRGQEGILGRDNINELFFDLDTIPLKVKADVAGRRSVLFHLDRNAFVLESTNKFIWVTVARAGKLKACVTQKRNKKTVPVAKQALQPNAVLLPNI